MVAKMACKAINHMHLLGQMEKELHILIHLVLLHCVVLLAQRLANSLVQKREFSFLAMVVVAPSWQPPVVFCVSPRTLALRHVVSGTWEGERRRKEGEKMA